MGMGVMLAKLFAKKLGGAFKVPVEIENGVAIMFPHKYEFKDRIADLATEKIGVSTTFMKELIAEAQRKHDLKAMKEIVNYLKSDVNSIPQKETKHFINLVTKYATEIKAHEILKHMVHNPFDVILSLHSWMS